MSHTGTSIKNESEKEAICLLPKPHRYRPSRIEFAPDFALQDPSEHLYRTRFRQRLGTPQATRVDAAVCGVRYLQHLAMARLDTERSARPAEARRTSGLVSE